MRKKIKDLLESVGITEFGCVRAREFSERTELMKKQVPFVSCAPNERVNPFLLMHDAKTVIVYLIPYKSDDNRTNLSDYAKGEDYHKVAKRISKAVLDMLESEGYEGIAFCDNGVLDDRYLAYLAGLGFYGRNGLLINDSYGSYTFIGYIITNCELSEDMCVNTGCMNCGLCEKSCPGGAISSSGIDYTKCVSYITQKKGELSGDEIEILKKSGYVWGCDICQSVCPHNKSVKFTDISSFKTNIVPNLLTENLSNREFLHKYNNRAFTWRGAEIIRRNIAIIEN